MLTRAPKQAEMFKCIARSESVIDQRAFDRMIPGVAKEDPYARARSMVESLHRGSTTKKLLVNWLTNKISMSSFHYLLLYMTGVARYLIYSRPYRHTARVQLIIVMGARSCARSLDKKRLAKKVPYVFKQRSPPV